MTIAETVCRIAELLEEADNIGLWVRSDDCSDNRNKRRLLREALQHAVDGVDATAGNNAQLEAQFRELVAVLEPLPDIVTDIMGKNPYVDLQIMKARDLIERLGATLPAA